MKHEDVYITEQIKQGDSEHEIRYFFTSKGRRNVIKIVEYCYLEDIDGYPLYNFGFGDYNVEVNDIVDDAVSDNGDVYKVFNIVLSTVPRFFESYKNTMIRVQGSDSRSSYTRQCRLTCKKRCAGICKNAHRRITIYNNYVNKNFKELSEQFVFYGNSNDVDGQLIKEEYDVNKRYNSIYLIKKNG